MIKLVLLVFMSSLFAQDHFTSVESTGLPYNIFITNISVDGNDPNGSAEVGIFDGDLCVGTAVVNGEFPFSVTAWRGDVSLGLLGFIFGNTISFKIWTEVFGEYHEFESTAVFSDGNGTFGSGAYSFVNLTVASGLYSKIVLSMEEINLGPVFVGETASQTIRVSNDGNADLTLFSIYSNNEQFFTDFSSQEEIEVTSKTDVWGLSLSIRKSFSLFKLKLDEKSEEIPESEEAQQMRRQLRKLPISSNPFLRLRHHLDVFSEWEASTGSEQLLDYDRRRARRVHRLNRQINRAILFQRQPTDRSKRTTEKIVLEAVVDPQLH